MQFILGIHKNYVNLEQQSKLVFLEYLLIRNRGLANSKHEQGFKTDKLAHIERQVMVYCDDERDS